MGTIKQPATGLAAFVDVETTGLSPARDEIIELGILLFAFDGREGVITEILDEYNGLREPVVASISPGARRVHGITLDMVKGAVLDDARVLSIVDRAEFVVAHNAIFDYGFLSRLYPQVAAKPWLCSMRQINWAQYGFRSRSLPRLLAVHGIRGRRAHRAGNDCRNALALLSRRSPRGYTYWSELLRARYNPVAGAVPQTGTTGTMF